MQRQIAIPGLQRTANGSTGANQFLGQIETGYQHRPSSRRPPPASRRSRACRAATVTQNAFSEWGANSLSLNVAQQTTNSLRTVFGADLAGAIRFSSERSLSPRPAPGLAARVCRHRPADHGGLRRRAVQRLHRLWRHAAARRRGDRLFGRHQHRRGDTALPALRRRGSAPSASNHTLNLGLRISCASWSVRLLAASSCSSLPLGRRGT